MKKNKTNKRIIVGVIVILSILIYKNRMNNIDFEKKDIYMIDVSKKTLINKKIKINDKMNRDEKIEYIFNNLEKDTSIAIKSIIPKSIIYTYEMDKDNLQFNIDGDITNVENMYLKGGLVNTFVGYENIKKVEVYYSNEIDNNLNYKLEEIDKSNLILNPIISPNKIVTRNIHLYFPIVDENGIKKIVRSINYNKNKIIERSIIEQIVDGTKKEKLESYIPIDTKVLSVKTENGICFVDFDKRFIDGHIKDVFKEKKTIYSVVNSLTESRNVKKVQILIESKKYTETFGGVDLSKPISRYEYIVK